MSKGVEIRGGAGDFEAAVIAVVLDRLATEDKERIQGRSRRKGPGLPAWVRALYPERPGQPRERAWPEV